MYKKPSVKMENDIKTMYQEIEKLIKKNNDIVDEIWKIEHALSSKDNSNEDKSSLVTLREKLKEEIKSNHFQEKIQALKEHVYELEMSIYGESNILSNSPNIFRF